MFSPCLHVHSPVYCCTWTVSIIYKLQAEALVTFFWSEKRTCLFLRRNYGPEPSEMICLHREKYEASLHSITRTWAGGGRK